MAEPHNPLTREGLFCSTANFVAGTGPFTERQRCELVSQKAGAHFSPIPDLAEGMRLTHQRPFVGLDRQVRCPLSVTCQSNRMRVTSSMVARLLGRPRMWAYRQIKAGRYGPVERGRGRSAYVDLAQVEAVEKCSFTQEQLLMVGAIRREPYIWGAAADIYAVEHPLGFLKVGQSRNVTSRFATVDGTSPIPLKLVYVGKVSDATRAENRIHRRLKAVRARGTLSRHEWFKIGTAEAIKIIKAECCAVEAELVAAAERQRRIDKYLGKEPARVVQT
jgi:Meiotically up-regulated gene 113